MYDYWDLKKIYEELKKENQQLKKQKDDVIEYIKKDLKLCKYENRLNRNDLLRMLGEIDVED